MGFMGALAGVGEGIQSYSAILGEQKKNEWENQKLQLQHERTESLEMLRSKNRLASQQAGYAQQEKMFGLQQEAKPAGYYEGQQVTRGDVAGMKEGGAFDAAKMQTPEQYKTDVDIDRAEKLHGVTTEMEQEARESKWQEMEASGLTKGWSEERKAVTKFAIFNPKISQALQKSGMSQKEQTDLKKAGLKAYEMGLKQWEDIQMDESEEAQQLVERIRMAASQTDDAPSNFFASKMMYDKFPELQTAYVESADLEGPVQEETVKLTLPRDVKEMAQDILSGDQAASSAYEKLDAGSKAKVDKVLGRQRKKAGLEKQRAKFSAPPVRTTPDPTPSQEELDRFGAFGASMRR